MKSAHSLPQQKHCQQGRWKPSKASRPSIDPARPSPNARGLSGLTRYGITTFCQVFNERQLLSLVTFTNLSRKLTGNLQHSGYPVEWGEAIQGYLALAIDRLADRNSSLCHWDIGYEKIAGTFQRFALRVNWDFCEVNPFGDTTGSYIAAIEWISQVIEHSLRAVAHASAPNVTCGTATETANNSYSVILTDPPYYDAIPYADLSDFFYVWLRRALGETHPSHFDTRLTPKDRELVQHAGRMSGNNVAAKQFYEDGMAQAFLAAKTQLLDDGRFVVVFAHKQPDARETLASAIIRAGFIVTASWPIQTEMPNKAAGGARLASSVWLVCKKRPATARSGWDNGVLDEMRKNIHQRLRDFWDAGIRGPDFVWAATGPALEAYSKHPVVKKADRPGELMSVADFLRAVRRIVVYFVVGGVLTTGAAGPQTTGLDDVTTYYLLHRHAFGMEDVPVGPCILYAVSCGLSDDDLVGRFELLARTGGKSAREEVEDESPSEEEEATEEASGSGSRVRLKTWKQRTRKTLGDDSERGPPPMIDQVHRLLAVVGRRRELRVNDFLERRGLIRNALFAQLLQALIELAEAGSDERARLERLSNHLHGLGPVSGQQEIPFPEP